MLSLLALLAYQAAAVPPMPKLEPDVSDYPIDVNVLCYPSGLKVVAARREGSTAVGVVSVIGGGKAAEGPDQAGAAHLLEHLWFRARPDGEGTVWENASGLDLTGETWLDATVYTTLGASADLGALVKLEGQRLTDPLVGVTNADIAAGREVVKREFLYRGGDTQLLVRSALEANLYPEGHPYHGRRVGPEQIDRLDRTKIAAYAETYTPKGTTLYLEGDVPTGSAELAALMEANLPDALLVGRSTACTVGRDQEVPEAPASTEPVVIEGLTPVPFIYLGWTLPRGYDDDWTLATLATARLEEHLAIALADTQGLRGREGARAYASCSTRAGRWTSEAVCKLRIPEGTPPEAAVRRVRTYLREVESDQEYGSNVPQTGLVVGSYWRRGLQAQDRLTVDDAGRRARWAHFAEAFDLWLVDAVGIQKAKPLDEVRFVRKWFTPDRMASVVLMPADTSTAAGSGSATWKPTLSAASPPRWTPVTSKAPLTERVLDNGMRVWVADQRGPGVPISMSRLALHGGEALAPTMGLDEGLAVSRVIDAAIDDVPYRALALLTREFYSDTIGGSTITRAGTMAAQLWMLGAWAERTKPDDGLRQTGLNAQTEPAFGDLGRTLDYIQARPDLFADAFRNQRLVPDAPGGAPWWIRYRAARGLRLNDIRSWWRTVYRPSNGALMVTGHVDPAEIGTLAERYLGFWKDREPMLTEPPPGPGQAAPAEITLLPFVRTQSRVSVSCRVAPRTPEAMPTLDVVQRLAARGLWQTLREDGRTYTPDVWLAVPHPSATVLHLEVEVMPGEAAAAITALRGVLGLIAEGPSDRVLSHEILAARSQHGIALSDAVGTQSVMLDHFGAGATLADLTTYGERLWKVDRAAVVAAMDGCIGHEAITVVGSDDLESLKALGIPAREADIQALAERLVDHMD